MEYIDGGNLRDFLQQRRNVFTDELHDSFDENIPLIRPDFNSLSTTDLVGIALQIANGMEWLGNVPVTGGIFDGGLI